MPDPGLPEGFVTLLGSLENWLDDERVPHALIGGVAVSLIAQPRFTADVDAVIWLERGRWESVVSAGSAHGFMPRIGDAIDFAERSRVLLLTHAPTGINVDIAVGALPFEKEAIDRVRMLQAGGVTLRVPTPEDLIIMKAVAHRRQDALDIEQIMGATANLDLRRIRYCVKEFADALEAPELISDLDRLLERE